MRESTNLSFTLMCLFYNMGKHWLMGKMLKVFFIKVDCVIKKKEWIKKNGNPWSVIVFPLYPEPSKVAKNNQMCWKVFS
jgi:hypothetical protein